ncbi:hypothetical protein PCE1_002722 [Barthelona sp. PCE]
MNGTYLDGCFDCPHYGHFLSCYKAKQLDPNNKLYVGIHDDATILRKKGPTVMTLDERAYIFSSTRHVDEVVPGAPWNLSLNILDQHNCAFAAHGDDLVLAADDGTDCYSIAKRAGRFRTFPRTNGISTSNLLSRILNMDDSASFWSSGVGFTAFSARFASLSGNACREATNEDSVIVVHGSFEFLTPGGVSLIEEAAKHGTYVVVSLISDEEFESVHGRPPFCTMLERCLNLLSIKWLDNIIMGTTYSLNEQFKNLYNITGLLFEEFEEGMMNQAYNDLPTFEADSTFKNCTVSHICDRIRNNKEVYIARNAKKFSREAEAFQNIQLDE